MKIIEIIQNLASAGAERVVVDLANQLVKHNHELVVITLFPVKESYALPRELDKRVRLVSLNKKLGFDAKMIPALYRTLKQEKADLVHTHEYSLNYLLLLLPFFKKEKFFHTVHNDAYKETQNPNIRKLRKQFYKTKKITAVTISDNSHESFLKAYGTEAVKIINGTREIKPTGDFEKVKEEIAQLRQKYDYVFVNIARVARQKNQRLLVEVFKKLNTTGVKACVLVIGEHRHKDQYDWIVQHKPDNIILPGEKSNATDYLFESDAFLLSSLWEGMPITVIEAFSAGCIPVSTPAGGVANMIEDGVNGFLSKDFTSDKLLEKIMVFTRMSSEEKQQMQNNCCKSYREKYSIETCAGKYDQLFSRVVGNNQ